MRFRSLPVARHAIIAAVYSAGWDRWAYLLLGVGLLAEWSVLAAARPDLRLPMLKVSAVGAVAGLLAEIWYFHDYWRPPTVLGAPGGPSVEDALFGFAVTGVGFAAAKVALGRRLVEGARRRYPAAAALAAGGLAALLVATGLLGWNSIFVSSGAFLGAAALMGAARRDLVRQGFASALLLPALVLPIYILLFDVLAPAYWDRHWLLRDTAFGVTVLGNIPVTEIVWYTSWGALAGIGYEFATGRRLVGPARS